MSESTSWWLLAASAVLWAFYEALVLWTEARHPERVARALHARMRVDWVSALGRQPGFEIVAVQTLRNSLMSATISASTAALALMGTITLAAPRLSGISAHDLPPVSPRTVLEIALMLVLFASFVCSAMAMRYFNHAGFVMSMPTASAERQPLMPLAAGYVGRAGLLYGWGLRCFLTIAPLVAGIVTPVATLPMTIALIAVLWLFDRPARTSSG